MDHLYFLFCLGPQQTPECPLITGIRRTDWFGPLSLDHEWEVSAVVAYASQRTLS